MPSEPQSQFKLLRTSLSSNALWWLALVLALVGLLGLHGLINA